MATNWRTEAACRGIGPDLFYPGEHTNYERQELDAICRHCPVTAACRQYALDARENYGWWAHTTPEDRRQSHKQTSELPTPVATPSTTLQTT